MSVAEPDRVVVAGRVELRPVPVDLARVLADPQAGDPGSASWATGYPLHGTRMAAGMLVRRAEASGDHDDSQWGMFEIVLRESGEGDR
jgi:hypothetical protein